MLENVYFISMEGKHDFKIEKTANRGDCLGMVGISREVKTFVEKKAEEICVNYKSVSKKTTDTFTVKIETENCHRYCGAVIKNVTICPSPLWMQVRLINAGIRPINNVVDITNYVLLEMNQPLHAFDMDKIEDNTIIIRDATDGEEMITLDDIKRKLTKNDIVIADKKQGHCLGGIMGGQISEVSDSTKNIFLEAAFFKPGNIRKTSKRLGLRSDSSYRFERTIDKENIDIALKRALHFFDKLGVGEIYEGIIDEYPVKFRKNEIEVTTDWINNKLGTNISEEKIINILSNLKFDPLKIENIIKVTTPSWRSDMFIKEDIAEEVARVYGYNNIVPTLFPGIQAAMKTDIQLNEKKILDILYNMSCDEVMNFSFVGKSLFDKMQLEDNHPYRKTINLDIPLTDDWTGIRTSLVPGMIKTVSYNMGHKNKNLSLFELGNVSFDVGEQMPIEEKRVCIALAGKKHEKSHNNDEIKYDFYDIKGIIDNIFEHFKIDVLFETSDESYLQPGQQAIIIANNKKIGLLGKVHPSICSAFDIDVDCFIAELNINKLFTLSDETIVYLDIPKFPSAERDLAIVIDEKITSKMIFDVINALNIEVLKKMRIFDVYKGKNIEQSKYSLAINFVFNKVTSTLTDKEVDKIIQEILVSLEKNCEAKLRV